MGHRLTLCLQKIPQRLFQSSKPVIAGSTLFASILANVVSVGGFGVCACCRSSGGVVGTVPGAVCGGECVSFYVLNLPFDHSFHPIQPHVAPWEASSMPSTKKKVRGAFLPFELCTPFIGIMSPPFCFLLRENVAGRKRSMENTMPV